MNTTHLKTFLWLRQRLTINQFRRAGNAGVVLSGILTALVVVVAVLALIIGFLVGAVALRTAPARIVMLAWDGAIIAFAFFWFAGLMSELQRSDALSLDRLLHLPVSPSSAFVINFCLSSLSLALILMLPAMTGLAAGLVASRGAGMLVLFPLIAAFLLMMSAVAYQFRGWLASLMQNARRRRVITAVVPVAFVLMVQLPNLWSNLGPGARERRDAAAERRRIITRLDDDRKAGRITNEEYSRRRPPAPQSPVSDGTTTRLVNAIAPPGWLAYGAESAVNGRLWPAFAGMLGMTVIGTLSLRRAYLTTLRLYRGDFERGPQTIPPRATSTARVSRLMAVRLPWTSDRVSGMAMAAFRTWSRAPEMKMALLTPVFMLTAFSRMFASAGTLPELMVPLRTAGLAGTVLIFGMAGPVANQFAYDRAGFRAFVLGPAPRGEVLLARNLAAFPFSFALMGVMVGISQWLTPMRVDYLAGVLLQLLSIYLVFCVAGNFWSIVTPVALKPGSGMPVPHQGLRSFGHFLFLPCSLLALSLTLLPLGADALAQYMNWFTGVRVYLVLNAVQLVVIARLYPLALNWQDGLLQRREQQILEIVGAKSE